MDDPLLGRLHSIVDDLHDALQSAGSPQELSHVVGVLNGMLKIYERTADAGIDFNSNVEPLVALPSQVTFISEKLSAMLIRIGDVKVRFST